MRTTWAATVRFPVTLCASGNGRSTDNRVAVRDCAAVLLVGVVASLLAVVPGTSASAGSGDDTGIPAAAATSRRPTSSISPTDPMPGERITWTVPTGLARTDVEVQYRDGTTWTTLRSYRTDSSGVVAATIWGRAVGTVTRYRLRSENKTLLRRKITTVEQSVTLGEQVDIGGNQVRMIGTFTPARPGRRGALLNDGITGMNHWDAQNASGQITFRITRGGTGSSSTYRAFALPYKGAPESPLSNPQTVDSLN